MVLCVLCNGTVGALHPIRGAVAVYSARRALGYSPYSKCLTPVDHMFPLATWRARSTIGLGLFVVHGADNQALKHVSLYVAVGLLKSARVFAVYGEFQTPTELSLRVTFCCRLCMQHPCPHNPLRLD